MAGKNLSETSSSSGYQSPMAGEGENLSETPSSSGDQSPMAGEGENRSETPSSSGDQSPTAGEGGNLFEIPSSSGDQSPTAGEGGNLFEIPSSSGDQSPTAGGGNLSEIPSSSGDQSPTAGEGENLSESPSSSGDQSPMAGEGENLSETPSSSGDQSPTAGEGENLSEAPSSSGDQSPMAGDRQNFSKTLPPSDQHQEMMPTAWAHLLTASATASSSGDQVRCNQSRDYDFHLQCNVKPMKLSPSHECLEDLFRDFRARRTGILKALTTEAERFYSLCDPEKMNLCLYGLHDETWKVNLPDEEAPPDMPEPVLGINFARDGMDKKEWLAFVAMHSDAWLLAVTFYFGARFRIDQESRGELFSMINNLPTIYEVVTGAAEEPTNETTPKNSSKINNSASQPPSPNEDPLSCSSKRAREE